MDHAISVTEKLCSKCQQVKPAPEFSPAKANRSGLASMCKECHRVISRRYYAERGGRERAQARQASYVLAVEGVKECKDCGETKDVSEFFRHKASPDGRNYSCKPCMTARNRQWKADNAEAYSASQVIRARRWHLKTRFGLTEKEYEEVLAAQNHVCAICTQPEVALDKRTGLVKRLHIDHDHRCCPGQNTCGKCIRGLLCRRCNQTIGHVNDNPELLMAMVRYLKDTSE